MSDEKPEARSIDAAVASVQRAVTVPKARFNEFGKFNYRSLEDIEAALKEPCEKAGVYFAFSDEVVEIAGRHYVRSTATASFDDGTPGTKSAVSYARECERKSGSDEAQITGMATSYARKYALCGLFAIDGGGDPDEQAPQRAQQKGAQKAQAPKMFEAVCMTCGRRFAFKSEAQRDQFLTKGQFEGKVKCCPMPKWAAV